MKMYYKYIAAIAFSTALQIGYSDDCEVHLMIANLQQTTEIPEESIELLNQHLERALTASPYGIVADPNYSQFYIGGKISHLYKDVVPGPPKQDVIHSNLTLYIGDNLNNKIYATRTFELRGVGTSEQRCYVNAFSQLNSKNKNLSDFIISGKDKIIDYYDKNYPSILKEADKAMSLHQYDEAAYYLMAIPVCCKGYSKAHSALVEAATAYVNEESLKLLNAARAAWSSHPDVNGAEEAMSYLLQIPSYASCYNEANKLHAEIAKKISRDWDYENRTKYENEIAIEKSKIDAMRAIGVAYGNGQKSNTTNLIVR